MKKYLCVEYPERKLLWFTVPKVGSKTIHDAFSTLGMRYRLERLRALENYHDDYFKFCFTRNPWDRVLSAFTDKTKKVWEPGGYADQLGEKVDIYTSLNFFKRWKDSSFRDFVLDLKNQDLWRDRHIQEQHTLIPVDQMDFIGKIENFQKDFDTLCSKLSLKPIILPVKNKTNHDHYSKYYDPEMVEIIREKYNKDIQLFQYEFNYE